MIKIIGFTRRNRRLTHDEYRAGHIGNHASYGRRLRNIRGYIVNVRSNESLNVVLAGFVPGMSRGEPDHFDTTWDGYGQLNFDSLDDYLRATEGEADRATADGLVVDELVHSVGGDGGHLYGGSPFQFLVDEHVVLTVRRPETKMVKLVQFVKRHPSLSLPEFRAKWFGQYAPVRGRFPGMRGLVFNLRDDSSDVLTGFLDARSDAFTPAGTATREAFYADWDGFAEIWYDSMAAFVGGHAQAPVTASLVAAEEGLFAATWYRLVDESVNVMPNRGAPPALYYR